MKPDKTTYIEPGYRRTSAGHKPIDGIQFFSYSVGILRYARISEDGQIWTSDFGNHGSTYYASVIGHGTLLNAGGHSKRFRTQDSAAKAAIKVWRKLQEAKR